MSAAVRGAKFIWTGSQYVPSALATTQFILDLTIGNIVAGETVQLTFTNALFIRTGIATATNWIPVKAFWAANTAADGVPVIVNCFLSNADTGEIAITFFNQLAADTDFNQRTIYFEVEPPIEVP